MPQVPSLDGKVALVTGASSGLGRHFAVTLARAGAGVAVSARRTDRLEDLALEISASGGRALAVRMDVTDVASVREGVAVAEAGLGPVSILVNDSGVSVQKPAVDVTEEDYDLVMDTNARGAFFVAQAVARRMIDRGEGGRIDQQNLFRFADEGPVERSIAHGLSARASAGARRRRLSALPLGTGRRRH